MNGLYQIHKLRFSALHTMIILLESDIMFDVKSVHVTFSLYQRVWFFCVLLSLLRIYEFMLSERVKLHMK